MTLIQRADWKEVAVIFGLLDQKDAEQYIIVQRAFLDAEGNNLFGLTEPDSIYFTDYISVSITESSTNRTSELELVNGNDVGVIKDDGVFPQDPNWLYQYSEPIDFLSEYELTVHNQSSGTTYTANTSIIQDFEIINTFGIGGFNLTDKNANAISWFNADNAAVYQLKLIIHYEEKGHVYYKPNG